MNHPTLRRRTLIWGAAAGALTGCTTTPNPQAANNQTNNSPTSASKGTPMPATRSPLVVYFSRPGWNYDNGGRTHLDVGNTQVLAQQLAALLNCPTHRIEPVDPYPDSYDETVARNVREQQAQARPAIANPLASLTGHDTILLGSPIWNVQAPRIMRTFIDAHDFTGITVAPFTTYAMSGLGTVPEEYKAACRNATRITEGLAIPGETVHDARTQATAWLRRIDLM